MSEKKPTTCSVCSSEFASHRGMRIHEETAHTEPWHDEALLRTLYVDYGVSSEKMGRYWGCDPKTVRNNLERYDIERRTPGHYQKKRYATYKPEDTGYCYWRDYSSENTTPVAVHRLLAVAEYGFKAVCDMHVHHKNGVKWDNRGTNIELKSPRDHMIEHIESGDIPKGPEAQKAGGYDPSQHFIGVPNDER